MPCIAHLYSVSCTPAAPYSCTELCKSVKQYLGSCYLLYNSTSSNNAIRKCASWSNVLYVTNHMPDALWRRGTSLDVHRVDYQEPEDALLIGPDAVAGDPAYAECARDAGRSASWCRSLTVTVHPLNHIIRFRYESALKLTLNSECSCSLLLYCC